MIPLWEPKPSHKTPWVTWTVLLLCGAGFVFHRTRDPYTQQAWLEALAFVPDLVDKSDEMLGPWTRALSALWLHTSVAHLAINALYLWVFGDRVESRLGHVRFASLFVISGLGGAVAQWATTPEASVPMVGASAAIAGILAARLLLYPREPITVWNLLRIEPLPAWMPVCGWFFVQSVATWVGMRNVAVGRTAANAAHLGGFFVGLAVTALFLAFERLRPGKSQSNEGADADSDASIAGI
ncbi:MAG: rhomboid family intramembrane serine protease [Deltaproteobacteria bacterium]|nr:rhomboid family intramembrane serine protease [Deltaproteobacteria bacterium]